LNVHKVSDVGQIEIHTAELLIHDTSYFEVEIAIAKLKRYKTPGSEQIPAELVQAGGKILRSKIHKLITIFGIRGNCLIRGRSILLCQFTKMAVKLIVVYIVGYHCCQLHTKFYPISFSQG
jgi:hypothetical protein